MKNTLLVAIMISMVFIEMNAQWINDPQNPRLVCDEVCVQNAVQQVTDDNGGTFVFWLDSRSGCNGNSFFDVYGQHYNANGNELWESGGREIVSYESSIISFAVMRSSSQEGIIIGAHSRAIQIATDSLRFQKFNDDGVALWANDLLIAESDGCEGNYFLGLENFSFIQNGNGYTVNLTPTYCGGSDGNRITHFTSDGLLTGMFNGEPEGNQFYVGSRGIDKTYDNTGDTYLYYTGGNGAGAHAFVMRVTAGGDSAWAPIDVLEGTNGLNYQYAAKSDPNGITICYQSSDGIGDVDLFLRRLNPDGTWAWNGDIITLCGADGGQGNFYWVQDETSIYVVWSDGRPGIVGNAAIYAQKIEKSTGMAQWQTDGVLVFDQATYIPYAKCVLASDGKLIVMNESGAMGFNAQSLNANGETEWDAIVSLSNVGLPFYADYQMLNSNGNIIVAWAESLSSGGADGIYIAQVAAPDVTIVESVTACDQYTSNGETFTSSGTYTQLLAGDTTYVLNLTITTANIDLLINGNTLEAQTSEGLISWLDCTDYSVVLNNAQTFTPTETGYYALMVANVSCVDTTECYLIEVTNVKEQTWTTFTAYPNPGNGLLTVKSSRTFNNARIEMVDALGKVVMSESQLNGQQTTLNTSAIPVGCYTLRIQSGEDRHTMIWTKM